MNEERPLLIYQKNINKAQNKMIIPKQVVDTFGYNYRMEIYKDKIVLIPTKEFSEYLKGE